jgi:hypothetical protein
MTPADEAARIFPALLARCRAMQADYGQPVAVPLAVYATDHDLAVLRPEDGGAWSAAFHREVMTVLVRLLAAEGFTATLKPLDAAEYLRWLAAEKLLNTAANRAAFIGL